MAESSVVNVSEYTAPVKRFLPFVIAAILLGAVAGFFLLQTRSDFFESTAVVQVKPLVSQSLNANVDVDRQINTTTEESVARSQRVTEDALAIIEVAGNDLASYDTEETLTSAQGLVPPAELVSDAREKIEVDVINDSQILRVIASDEDADEAAQLAQAVAVAYIEFRKAEALNALNEASEALNSREVSLKEEAARLFAGGQTPRTYEIVAIEEELAQIGRAFATLESSTVDPGSVISDAEVPESTEGLPFFAGPGIGALLGMVFALALVFVIDRQDDRLRSASTELSELGVPVLGTAPVHQKKTSGISLFANNSPGADSYRRVQASMLFNLDQEGKSLIVVTGVKSSRASGFVAANLAAMAARSGRRTLLVGANLRVSQLHDGVGLSDVVLGKASLANAIENLSEVDPNFDVLGGGTSTSRPADILQSEAFSRVMNAIHVDYDLVLVDAPGLLEVADAVDISRLAQGALVVVDSTSDSRKDIASALGQLKSVGSSTVGVVITEPAS